MITRITFDEVKYHAKKRGKCKICGKHRTRQQTFSQTLNPFNKNTDGSVKTRYQIMEENKKEAAEWKKEPIICCEISERTDL
jgi:hypothetical protein